MSQPNLPDDHHIVRYVPWTKVDKDADDNVRGILPTAYATREGEEGLSVNWLERAEGADRQAKLFTTVALIQCTLKVGRKGRLAVSNVQRFKEICRSRDRKIRIVHAPIDNNEPHAEIRQIPRDDDRLLEQLVLHAVIDHICCGDLMD